MRPSVNRAVLRCALAALKNRQRAFRILQLHPGEILCAPRTLRIFGLGNPKGLGEATRAGDDVATVPTRLEGRRWRGGVLEHAHVLALEDIAVLLTIHAAELLRVSKEETGPNLAGGAVERERAPARAAVDLFALLRPLVRETVRLEQRVARVWRQDPRDFVLDHMILLGAHAEIRRTAEACDRRRRKRVDSELPAQEEHVLDVTHVIRSNAHGDAHDDAVAL